MADLGKRFAAAALLLRRAEATRAAAAVAFGVRTGMMNDYRMD